MNIIYLDIDGVLNCENGLKSGECKYIQHDDTYHKKFYSENKYWLNKLIKETNAKIVVSSTWRRSGLEWLRIVWKQEEMEGEIIDVTPNFKKYNIPKYTIPRGCEIEYHLNKLGFNHINWCKNRQEKYMTKSGINNYIIIDDDGDMLYGQRNHFIHVLPSPRNKNGFSKEHYKKGVELLNKSVIDLNYND